MNKKEYNILNDETTQRPIVKLDEKVANQIAAGEVIESPAAIVKELVENSIDAGATSIDILVSQGGKSIIQVKDNGWGIPREELPIAVCRHATSKLIDNEILKVNTYGFRGEALPSIGSSGRLNIKSKIINSQDAWEIFVENDNVGKVLPASLNIGTFVEVRDLFYKTPARLKFLKSDKNELRAILDIFKRLSLINPQISFSLREISLNGLNKSIANYKGVSFNIKDQSNNSGDYENKYSFRVSQVLGGDIFQNLLPIFFSKEDLVVEGFISLPTFSRSTLGHQYFFVNGRPVWDKNLTSSVRVGYSDFIMKGRYPVAVILIKCPADTVDANVHPAKTEVRFQNLNYIKNSIISIIKSTIASFNTKTSTAVSEGMMQAFKRNISYNDTVANKTNNSTTSVSYPFKNRSIKNTSDFLFNEVSSRNYQAEISSVGDNNGNLVEKKNEKAFPLGSPVAHIHENYIISQTSNGMAIIDQHAAHERIVYEKLKSSLKHKSIASQTLLIPEIVELGEERSLILLGFNSEFKNLGLILEPFGKKSICVRSLPEILGQVNCSLFLNDLADELLEHNNISIAEEKLETVISKIACHGSVRSGRKLNPTEMSVLLRTMEETPFSNQCNHGRPTFIELKLKDIEKLFNRN